MEVDKKYFETMIMFLYHTGEFEACEKVFEVYKKHFCEVELPQRLRLAPSSENDQHE